MTSDGKFRRAAARFIGSWIQEIESTRRSLASKRRFLEFIKHNVVREFPNHKYLLMDNARIHHCKEIKEFIIRKGKVPVYTIPYTPELNPIENAFSVLKQNVRQEKPKNKNELLKALRISKKQIDSVMSENIFKKSFGLTDYRIVR